MQPIDLLGRLSKATSYTPRQVRATVPVWIEEISVEDDWGAVFTTYCEAILTTECVTRHPEIAQEDQRRYDLYAT